MSGEERARKRIPLRGPDHPVKYWVVRYWGDKWVCLRDWPACVTNCCLVSQKPGGDEQKHSLFASQGKGGRIYLKVGRSFFFLNKKVGAAKSIGAEWQLIDFASVPYQKP